MSVDIEYNGTSIATIGAGQMATLSCRGKLMEGDVVISSPESESCEVTYNGNKIADVPMGARVTVHTEGEQMEDDVVIEVVNSILALDSPTISLEGDILTITDESGLAEEFDILVDGEVKTTVEAVVEPDNPEGSEGLAYTLSKDETYYTCTGIGTCTDTDIVIASEYEGLPVKIINSNAFDNKDNITSVIIPDSVTSIGYSAFYHCDSLTSVTIGNSVTSIGTIAFEYCYNLTSIEIGDGVTYIGGRAFRYCSSLAEMRFKGTKAEWNSISKEDGWNSNIPATYVQCTDGTVAI